MFEKLNPFKNIVKDNKETLQSILVNALKDFSKTDEFKNIIKQNELEITVKIKKGG